MSGRPGEVCTDCQMHQGSTGPKMLQRDVDHLRAWREVGTSLEAEVRRQETAVADKQAELDARPVRVVTENLDLVRVEEAVAERDRAYSSRDRAFHLLSAAVLLHQEAASGKCACGLAFKACEVGQLLEEEGRGLRDWEKKQRERMEDGHSHWLPANHPFVIDQRGRAARSRERAG